MSDSANSHSFLVVGGGVVGLSLAWELSQRGQTVSLLSAGATELRSASWAGAGILPPVPTKNAIDPLEQLRSLSHQLHHHWAERLLGITGIDTGFRRCGGIYLATSRAELASLLANQMWWDEHGIAYQRLGVEELLRLEPALANMRESKLLDAWRLPEECQLRNPRHLKALAAACRAGGVKIVDATIATIEKHSSGRTTLIDTRGQRYEADRICLCTGAWSRMLMEQVELDNGIMPIRGQMLLYQCPPKLLTHIINDGNRYVVQREDGLLLAGSVEEEAGYNCITTEESLSLIRSWAEATLPQLKYMPLVHSWAGLRPGSFDGMPYIGQAPGLSNLYIAAGHFRSGLHLSCGTAQVMADLMLGLEPSINLDPFRIARG